MLVLWPVFENIFENNAIKINAEQNWSARNLGHAYLVFFTFENRFASQLFVTVSITNPVLHFSSPFNTSSVQIRSTAGGQVYAAVLTHVIRSIRSHLDVVIWNWKGIKCPAHFKSSFYYSSCERILFSLQIKLTWHHSTSWLNYFIQSKRDHSSHIACFYLIISGNVKIWLI